MNDQVAPRVRTRLRFSKLGKVRFTSHRDTARIWERTLRKAELREHSPNVDDRLLGRALQRPVGDDQELLSAIVFPDIARLLDPHPLRSILHLVLVENEADVSAIVERRHGQEGDDDPDRAGEGDLRDALREWVASRGEVPGG